MLLLLKVEQFLLVVIWKVLVKWVFGGQVLLCGGTLYLCFRVLFTILPKTINRTLKKSERERERAGDRERGIGQMHLLYVLFLICVLDVCVCVCVCM